MPGAGTSAALLVGAWLGRASSALPAGVEDTIDALLPLAAAAAIALSFRRWLRRRVQARSRGERA